jgi:glycosyltransferase involved in cell wall biosynthesis
MMKNRGHTVYLYAGEQNEAPCDECIPCVTEKQRAKAVGNIFYTTFPFDPANELWTRFNRNAIKSIKKRIKPRDFICVIGGRCHMEIANSFPGKITVEFGIGYSGVFAQFKVFESYAWMHAVYGQGVPDASQLNGVWYDAVIPSYIEMEKFPFSEKKDDYYLYMGRLIQRKGYSIAIDACKILGKKLILAGDLPEGEAKPSYGEWIGPVGPEKRGELMSKATAVFVPTIYIEPFGTVNVEAQACGTPVITTDWGAFTETVLHGTTGFRCRSLREFLLAAEDVKKLDPKLIHQWAKNNYSLEAVGFKYEQYFKRLYSIWGKGWYETEDLTEEVK